jgi:probable HAF family extracellular repeat protein
MGREVLGSVRAGALVFTLALAFGIVGPVALAGPQYVVTDLGTAGQTHSEAWSVNNSGQVTGRTTGDEHAFLYSTGVISDLGPSDGWGINASAQVVGVGDPSIQHAILWSNSGTTDLGTLGGLTSAAFGINDSGQIVGWSDTGNNGPRRAFLYSGGVMNPLGTLGGPYSQAFGINNAGQVTGDSALTGTGYHAFLYSGGIMTDLGGLDGSNSSGVAINASGQVVGWSYSDANNRHAVLYCGGVVNDLGTLGGTESQAYGINDIGEVTGVSDGHAFLYSNGVMYDLNNFIAPNSGWVLYGATDINNVGQIVGYGSKDGNANEAFLLTPIPEPAAIGPLFWAATILMGKRIRR